MSPKKIKRAERLNTMNKELSNGKISQEEYNAEMILLYPIKEGSDINYHYRVDNIVSGDVKFFTNLKDVFRAYKELNFKSLNGMNDKEIRKVCDLEVEYDNWDKGLVDSIIKGNSKMPYDEAKLTIVKGDI